MESKLGVLQLVLLRLDLGRLISTIKRRNKQEEPFSGPDPLQTLTQVIQLLQSLPLDPRVKDQLRDSLQGHVAPMLQPKKSTAELIHEKQTERANEESAWVIMQNKNDLLMTNVQKISQEIDAHVQRMATLDNELLDLHAELQLQKPTEPPPVPDGPMPTVQEMPYRAPDLLETMADDLDMTHGGRMKRTVMK